MNLSMTLWNLVKDITPDMKIQVNNLLIKNINERINYTNQNLKKLGMNTNVYLLRAHKDYIICEYKEEDASLFDINFFYMFLQIYISEDGIFHCGDLYSQIRRVNKFFDRSDLSYKFKMNKEGQFKMYNIILTEYSLKL